MLLNNFLCKSYIFLHLASHLIALQYFAIYVRMLECVSHYLFSCPHFRWTLLLLFVFILWLGLSIESSSLVLDLNLAWTRPIQASLFRYQSNPEHNFKLDNINKPITIFILPDSICSGTYKTRKFHKNISKVSFLIDSTSFLPIYCLSYKIASI